MTTVELYRDDGPLGALLARLGRQPAPVAAILGGALLIVSTFRTDGASPGWLSVVGVTGFIVLACLGHRFGAPRLGWLVPPLLRAAEYGVILYLAWRTGGAGPAAAFALLGAVAFHQYDVDHRMRTRGAPPPKTVGHVGLGWDGRMLAMSAAAAAGVFSPAAVVLAAVIVTAALVENLIVWRHQPPTLPHQGAAGK